MSDISDEPRAFSVDEILAAAGGVNTEEGPEDMYEGEVFEVHSMDGNVQMIAVADTPYNRPTDAAEVGHRLMLAH